MTVRTLALLLLYWFAYQICYGGVKDLYWYGWLSIGIWPNSRSMFAVFLTLSALDCMFAWWRTERP